MEFPRRNLTVFSLSVAGSLTGFVLLTIGLQLVSRDPTPPVECPHPSCEEKSSGPDPRDESGTDELEKTQLLDQLRARIEALEATARAPSATPRLEDDVDYVLVTLFNSLQDEVSLFSVVLDERKGAFQEEPLAIIPSQQQLLISSEVGAYWRLKTEASSDTEGEARVVAELFVGPAAAQPFDVQRLKLRWNAMPEDQRLPLLFEEVRVDPDGLWVSSEPSFRERFTVFLAEDDSLVLELKNGDFWSFTASETLPDTYTFAKAFDGSSRPTFTSLAADVQFRFLTDNEAELTLGQDSTTTFYRSHVASVRNVLATSLIEDPAWDDWVKLDQGQEGTMPKYTSADWASEPIGGSFSGELIGSKAASYTGYNVLKMDPLNLGSRPGVDGRARVFEMIADDSLEWSTAGTGYRIPWSLYLQSEVKAKSKTNTSVFFSERHREDQFGVDVTLPQGLSVGHQETESRLEANNQVSVRATRWAAEYWLILNKRYAELSTAFTAHVLALPELPPTTGEAYDQAYARYVRLFEVFGTHYPLSTLYGGRAYLEEVYEAKEVADALSSKTGFEYTKEATLSAGSENGLGISVPVKAGVRFGTEESSGSREKVEKGLREFTYSGGKGGNFEAWDLAENKLLQPIRVDLRPIYEVILPKLFGAMDADDSVKILRRREDIQMALCNYLLSSEATDHLSTRPLAYEISIQDIVLKKGDDGTNDTTNEVFGSVTLSARHNGAEFQDSKSAWQESVANRVSWRQGDILPKLNHDAAIFYIPTSEERWSPDGGHLALDQHQLYALHQYELVAEVKITDHDKSSANDRSSITIQRKLSELDDGMNLIEGIVYYKGSDEAEENPDAPTWNGGKYTVKVRMQQLGYPIVANPDENFPDFPNYRTTTPEEREWCKKDG